MFFLSTNTVVAIHLQEDLFQQPGLRAEFEQIRDCLDMGMMDTLGILWLSEVPVQGGLLIWVMGGWGVLAATTSCICLERCQLSMLAAARP